MDTRNSNQIVALAYDVFGTVADWKSTIVAEGRRLAPDRDVDWIRFASDWMREYGRAVSKLTHWRPLDELLREAFVRLAPAHGLGDLPHHVAEELGDVWSHLRACPDAGPAFDRLKGHYLLTAFSNANFLMLMELYSSTGLPWDGMISGEDVGAYKPDPAVYRNALVRIGNALGRPDLSTASVMVVASHTFDLNAARRQGFRTALIERPEEPGSEASGLDHEADFIVPDLEALATALLGDGRETTQG